MPGVLYARVAGTWVPVSNGNPWSIAPAYVGPRTDGGTSDARFGHVSLPTDQGFMVRNDGSLWAQPKNGSQFSVYSDGAIQALFKSAYSWVNGVGMGTHPQHGTGWDGIWSEQTRNAVNGADYIILKNRSSGQLLLNGWNSIELRVANTNKIAIDTNVTIYPTLWCNAINSAAINTQGNPLSCSSITSSNRIYSSYTPYSGSWDTQNFVASGYGNFAAMALNCPGYAVNVRCGVWNGQALEVLALDMSIYVQMIAGGFVTQSSLDVKRDVRPLHHERERIVVHHDPWADEVPVLDVMSLRPVAFRPTQPNKRMVPAPGYDEIDPENKDSWIVEPEPEGSSFGIQGTRERLGLVAEEVQHVVPSAVSHDKDGKAVGIDYAQITVALLDHVQQLTELVATLKYRITELEAACG